MAVETCGALTGFPFGRYSYTDRFGPELGVVPLTIPLAWHVVLTNALFLVRALAPHLPRLGEAAGVGAIATLYDAVLEPFAVRVKGYWFWQGSGAVPLQNYAAWFVISALLAFAFAPATTQRGPRDIRPAILLGATVVLFIAGIWRGGIRL
jgi:putative membrane protein